MTAFNVPVPGSFGVFASVNVEKQDAPLAGSLQSKIQAVNSVKNASPPTVEQSDVMAQVVPTGVGDT